MPGRASESAFAVRPSRTKPRIRQVRPGLVAADVFEGLAGFAVLPLIKSTVTSESLKKVAATSPGRRL